MAGGLQLAEQGYRAWRLAEILWDGAAGALMRPFHPAQLGPGPERLLGPRRDGLCPSSQCPPLVRGAASSAPDGTLRPVRLDRHWRVMFLLGRRVTGRQLPTRRRAQRDVPLVDDSRPRSRFHAAAGAQSTLRGSGPLDGHVGR
jgi:hypothetical protein